MTPGKLICYPVFLIHPCIQLIQHWPFQGLLESLQKMTLMALLNRSSAEKNMHEDFEIIYY